MPKFISIFLLTILLSTNSNSADIVRLQIDYNGSPHNLDLELFADKAPLTVANYLDYVTTGSYDGTFMYRSIPGFILQTGGYTFRPLDPVNDALRPIIEATGLDNVTLGPLSPVVNEFNQSNLRGTIAMAKLPEQPDSASNEWFINLADNSENLDAQNGGFTVFGSVIDDGMTFADEISAFPIHQFIHSLLGSAFADMPVTGEIFGAIFQADMIMISNSIIINRPIVRLTPDNGDFDLDIAGDTISKTLTVTLKNTGDEVLDIGVINPADLSLPFNITNDNCSNSTLSAAPTSICTIDVIFSPTVSGPFTDSLLVPYTSQATGINYSVTYTLLGEGVPPTPVIYSDTTSLNFFDTLISTNVDNTVTFKNKGGGTLSITNLGISGTDAIDFSILSGCNIGTTLTIGQSCTASLRFLPTTSGIKNGVLNLESNAGSININLSGEGTKPTLSVPSSINLIAQVNQSVDSFVFITNTGTGDLALNNISITGTDAALFTQLNNCPDTNNAGVVSASLGASEQCVLLVNYTPTVAGSHTATITIDSNDPDTPSINIALTGSTGDPKISVPASIFIGTAQVSGNTITGNLVITNSGQAPLEITAISGLSGSDFVQTNTCVGSGVQITAGNFCTVAITYAATVLGNVSAVISIETNDPAAPVVTVSVEAYGDKDTDGIPSEIELNSPNSGDGNNDGILDETQNNVTSFITSKNEYVTLISDNSLITNTTTTLHDVTVENSNSITMPDGTLVAFNFDLYGFNLKLPDADSVNVAIFLPAGDTPDGYYRFGPTLDDTTPHWYEFGFDEATQTGATFIGNVSIKQTDTSSTNIIQRYMVVVSYRDGALGDDDLTINGTISQNKGGVYFIGSDGSNSGSGTLSIIFLLLMTSGISYIRKF